MARVCPVAPLCLVRVFPRTGVALSQALTWPWAHAPVLRCHCSAPSRPAGPGCHGGAGVGASACTSDPVRPGPFITRRGRALSRGVLPAARARSRLHVGCSPRYRTPPQPHRPALPPWAPAAMTSCVTGLTVWGFKLTTRRSRGSGGGARQVKELVHPHPREAGAPPFPGPWGGRACRNRTCRGQLGLRCRSAAAVPGAQHRGPGSPEGAAQPPRSRGSGAEHCF